MLNIKVNNSNFILYSYKFSFLIISLLIALDPGGDWLLTRIYEFTGSLDLGFDLIQNIILYILILSNTIIILNLFFRKKFYFIKELILVIFIILFSCLVGFLKGATLENIIIESSSYFLLPTSIVLFINYKKYFNENFFRNCYYLILTGTLIKIGIYFFLLGDINFLFKPGSLKLSTIYFCHSLGLLYVIVNNKYRANFNIFIIILSALIGILSIQKSYLILIFSLFLYILIKAILKFKINFIPTILLMLIPIIIVSTDYRINFQNLRSSFFENVSFQKRYETLICFSKQNFADYFIGTGIGSEIICSQEKVLDKEKFLRVNQTELELLSLLLKTGLINGFFIYLLFKNWLKKNINNNSFISSSVKSTLFFTIFYSLFQSAIASIYNLFFILILILWNISGNNYLFKEIVREESLKNSE